MLLSISEYAYVQSKDYYLGFVQPMNIWAPLLQ